MKGNQSNDNTCWWYFSDRSLSVMNKNFNAQEVVDLKEEIQNWKTIQTASKASIDWAVQNSRFYASVRDVPDDQKLFAVKQYVATFFTDDAIEHLNSHPDFSCTADAFFDNLRKIWSGIFDDTTDLNRFKGLHNIPDVYIENAIRVLDIQTELGRLAEKLLQPKVLALYKYNAKAYLDGCLHERPLFHKHIPNRTYISESEGKNARIYSIGLQWILPTNMTDENSAIHLTHINPAVLLSAWIVALENDVVGYSKDKNAEFCPMSFCRRLSESGKSDLDAVRTIINKTNKAKRGIDTIWNEVPVELSKHYEYSAQYVMGTTDWSFPLGYRNSINLIFFSSF